MRVLIVGGGLSGICLAHHLEELNVPFKLVDRGSNYSSRIAAGMINPMVFRKMVKTWKGDLLIPYLQRFYPAVEQKVGQRFFFPRTIRRVFSTPEEAELWKVRTLDTDYKEYIFIGEVNDTKHTPDYTKATYGNGIVKSPGYIDARIFMNVNHAYFEKKKKLMLEAFDFDSFDEKTLTYKSEPFDAVVFSEGYQGKDNPFFHYLPLQQTKGEVLIVESEELKKDEILNRKCFILPTVDGKFRLGATFTWNTSDPSPTEKAREELLDQYEKLSSAPISVLDQEGGIRPTVTDRRPLIGEHPTKKGIYIFNGMGTKGYMIAPYFAAHFCDHLLKQKPLDEEVDIQRFYNKHFLK